MPGPIKLRPSKERGHARHGWLESYHTFSFADYHDPRHMGFRSLRVINEDWIAAGRGFGMHPHRDMEIVTMVLEGALEHKDSMGNSSIIRPGEVQRMSAGTGVTHSEFNHSKEETAHIMQIWILPERPGLKPGYEQKVFSEAQKKDRLKLIASPDGREGSVTVHQDIGLYECNLSRGTEVAHQIRSGRGIWIQTKQGELKLNGHLLKQGDGAAIEAKADTPLHFQAEKDCSFLLFDMV